MYDAYNDEEVVLSREELRMIQRIRAGQPSVAFQPPHPLLIFSPFIAHALTVPLSPPPHNCP